MGDNEIRFWNYFYAGLIVIQLAAWASLMWLIAKGLL